ncbi:pilus assembly protein TadB [Propionibacterium freudenreichii]|uniref:Type II secretion system protein (Precursor) n=2 Tax=Propionibacterium freudenreichii TaxID=1744 RepID=A0A0A8SAN5_9ACTN|nr:type II secretion system F family protein [Propionibacterium freudenreichii]MDN5962034.1 type II secretion system F family protein [Propionibacterium sp.]AJQ91677.1 Hypothetical protein RM25_1973 [Propionibacterium freudenreichii subsp. freudenreichii]ARO11337.1 hypothetical protein BMR99_01170 [Propionibacterium freudenreichii]AWY95002.1 Type II secretion system protein (Precursor) [Propionibacterium freudenreichii]MCQ1998089.1 type II secretion system F family protein [Propionibacterium f
MNVAIFVALAAAVWLLVPARQEKRLAGLDLDARPLPRWPGIVLGVLAVLGLLGACLAFVPHYVAWGLIACVLGATLAWELRMHRAERSAIKRSQEVAHACRVMSAQLRIGQTPAQALAVAAEECEVLAGCRAAQQVGADVPRTLMAAGDLPGCSGLAALGRAWKLCERSGSPLAPAATRVSQTVDGDARLRADIAAELAVPRATGRLLTALPLLGIGMGFVSGGDPVAFLTTTMIGKACLVGAVVLVCAGLVWTELLATRAQEHR